MESRASALRFPVLVPPEPTLVSFSEAAMVLRKWEKPVFLIWGDADHVFPIETAGEALHRIFRTSNKPIRIEGGTHFVQESAPERITKEIIMFLKKDIQ
jgi:pimeloyl-ACP methyl ester carboxylesterase